MGSKMSTKNKYARIASKEKRYSTYLKKMVKIRELNTYKNLRTDRINEKEA